MFNQIAQQCIGKPLFVGPRGIAKNAVQRFRVGFLNAAHGFLQGYPDIGGDGPHIAPMAIFRYLETVVLREQRIFLVTARFRQCGLMLLIMHVG